MENNNRVLNNLINNKLLNLKNESDVNDLYKTLNINFNLGSLSSMVKNINVKKHFKSLCLYYEDKNMFSHTEIIKDLFRIVFFNIEALENLIILKNNKDELFIKYFQDKIIPITEPILLNIVYELFDSLKDNKDINQKLRNQYELYVREYLRLLPILLNTVPSKEFFNKLSIELCYEIRRLNSEINNKSLS